MSEIHRCPGCGATSGGGLCGECRRDDDLGERLGTSRREIEEELRDSERDTWREGLGEEGRGWSG